MAIVIFPFLKGLHPHHHVVKINFVSVKFGAIHANELRFAVNRNAASSAHSGTVNHNRI